MIMRGKQRPCPVHVVQMFQRGPSDGETIISGRPAANFIKDDQGAVIRLVQDRGGFDHLDHEGRAPARQIVRRADATEKLADNADMGRACGHETAHLRHQRNQGVLPQEGRFTGHVRAGQQPDVRGFALGTKVAVIGDKRLA